METCIPPREEVDADDEEFLNDPHHIKAWELGLEMFHVCKHCDAISDHDSDEDD